MGDRGTVGDRGTGSAPDDSEFGLPLPPAGLRGWLSRPLNLVYVVSVLVHVGIGVALSAVQARAAADITVIEMTTIEQPDKPEPEPPKPAAPVAAPPPSARRSAPAAKAPNAAPPPPDFGFAMSGGGDGPGGIAVGPAPVAPPPVKQAVKRLAPVKAAEVTDACLAGDPSETKAKATNMPRPTYTDEARTAGISGKVRVQLTIDEAGKVTDAKVLEGLGHGLDEAAVAALQGATFLPATRCGKPVVATFVVGVTFKP